VDPRRRHRVFDLGGGDGDPQGQHLPGSLEAGVDVAQGLEAADHEPGADEQHQRGGDLGHHQEVARPAPLPARARPPALGLQRRDQVGRPQLEDGRGAEEQRRQERDSQGEEEDRGVQGDLVQPRQTLGPQGDQQGLAGPGQAQAHGAAGEAQEEALGEQVPGDAAAAGAQGAAHGQLVLAAFGADEEEVGHVGARHQEHHAHGAQQHPQDTAHVPHHLLLERSEVGPEPQLGQHALAEALRRWERLQGHGDHAGDVGVRLLQGHPGAQACHALVAEVAEEDLPAVEAEGQVEVGLVVQELQVRRQHADDLPGGAVDGEAAPQHPRVAAEAQAPVVVGEDHRLGGEEAADPGLDAQEG